MEVVFVLHGVDYRGREADFAEVVGGLADATGLDLRPVFWGDLAAQTSEFGSVVPTAGGRTGIRDDEDSDGAQRHRAGGGERGLALVAEGVARGLEEREAEYRAPALMAEVEALWPEVDNLRLTDDVAVLREVGSALVDLALDVSFDGRLREPDPGAVRRCLVRFDRLVGAAQAATAGRMNSAMRTQCLPGIARYLGDVLVYQRNQAAIHLRVREVIAAVDPTLGTERSPARLVAHSLGGVVAMDLATAAEPLWVESLVTFGSQWPLFHLVDPRGGAIAPRDGVDPVALPRSLGAWTNVWEPLDPLAFVTGGHFVLHDGTVPTDVGLRHLATWGLWTHSVYWRSRSFMRLLGQVFGKEEGTSRGQS